MRKLIFFQNTFFVGDRKTEKKNIFQEETGLSTVYKIFWILSELVVKS
jgi:hypothetical protein